MTDMTFDDTAAEAAPTPFATGFAPCGRIVNVEPAARGRVLVTTEVTLSGGEPFGLGMRHPVILVQRVLNPFDALRFRPEPGDRIGFREDGTPVADGRQPIPLDRATRAGVFALLRQPVAVGA